jgi:hypothetical protein
MITDVYNLMIASVILLIKISKSMYANSGSTDRELDISILAYYVAYCNNFSKHIFLDASKLQEGGYLLCPVNQWTGFFFANMWNF